MYDPLLVEQIMQRMARGAGCWLWLRAPRQAPDLIEYDGLLYNVPRLLFEERYGSIIGRRLPAPRCGKAGCINPEHRYDSAARWRATGEFYLPQPYQVNRATWRCENIESAIVYTQRYDATGALHCDCPYGRTAPVAGHNCWHVEAVGRLHRQATA